MGDKTSLEANHPERDTFKRPLEGKGVTNPHKAKKIRRDNNKKQSQLTISQDAAVAFKRVSYLRQISKILAANPIKRGGTKGSSEKNSQNSIGSGISAFYGNISYQVERKLVMNVDSSLKNENCPNCKVSAVDGVTITRKIKGLRNIKNKMDHSKSSLAHNTLVGYPYDTYVNDINVESDQKQFVANNINNTVVQSVKKSSSGKKLSKNKTGFYTSLKCTVCNNERREINSLN